MFHLILKGHFKKRLVKGYDKWGEIVEDVCVICHPELEDK